MLGCSSHYCRCSLWIFLSSLSQHIISLLKKEEFNFDTLENTKNIFTNVFVIRKMYSFIYKYHTQLILCRRKILQHLYSLLMGSVFHFLTLTNFSSYFKKRFLVSHALTITYDTSLMVVSWTMLILEGSCVFL